MPGAPGPSEAPVTVTLENRSPRRKIFHLTHDHACSGASCSCARVVVGVQDHNPKTGVKSLRALRRRLPGSITLLARGHEGAKVSGLPETILADAEVAKAIRAKQIAWAADDEGGSKKVAAHHPHAAGKLAAQAAAQAAAEAHEASIDHEAERTEKAQAHAAEQEKLVPRLLGPDETKPGGTTSGSKKAEG
jgi:hypothetical protein